MVRHHLPGRVGCGERTDRTRFLFPPLQPSPLANADHMRRLRLVSLQTPDAVEAVVEFTKLGSNDKRCVLCFILLYDSLHVRSFSTTLHRLRTPAFFLSSRYLFLVTVTAWVVPDAPPKLKERRYGPSFVARSPGPCGHVGVDTAWMRDVGGSEVGCGRLGPVTAGGPIYFLPFFSPSCAYTINF